MVAVGATTGLIASFALTRVLSSLLFGVEVFDPVTFFTVPVVRIDLATTTMDPKQTALALMTAGREVDPDLWVWETKTMSEHLGITRLPAQLSAF